MAQQKLSQLNEGDTFQDGFLLVRSLSERTSLTGKPYCDIALADRESEISAKLWDANKGNIKAGMIVKVRGAVVIWQNRIQLNIEKIREITEDDEVDFSDIIPTAPMEPEEMMLMMYDFCASIEDDGFRSIAQAILEEEEPRLLYAPAAKANHHSERGGLLHHTLSVLKAAEQMCILYPLLNRDVLISGAILHDICKLDEMDSSELGIVTEYTPQGNLMGHLVLGAIKVAKMAEKLGVSGERALILEHMMITHHGEPELGSVRTPMFPEAEMLHHLDIIDARMFDYARALKKINIGEFSEWNKLLERRLYKHEFSKI